MGKQQMSDLELLDMNADEVGEFIDALEPQQATLQEQADLLAQLPPADPEAPTMVVTSLRLPMELKQRLDAAAAEDGVSASVFIRSALESVLAGRNRSNLVSLDDLIRAARALPRAA